APLTIGHATFSTEIHAPGGASLSARMWQESFAATATEKFAQLQRQAGSDASLLIENGEPLKVLPRLLARAKADLLIAGHWATSERWGRGEAWNDESGICRMIRHARVPVLVFKSEIPPPVQPDPVPSAGRRLVTNLVILLPTILILVAALTIGVLKTRPAHFSVRQWWNSARGE
ncbi:MAG: universal stress protein, partial [Alphaproteobacteria bacterium]|nr:universal stress protein [Alphaproteobacteria bacterium]